jgi:catechol 2,3-dioxygenase-like lactoylglutathione lyase family enzyme
VHALVRFGLNSPNTLRLARFYEQAFGADVQSRERQHARQFMEWAGVQGGAERTVLGLGDATLELLEFDHPGRPYPKELSPYDDRFQHFGLVVTDMRRAMERLSQAKGWTAISTEGPQTLPQSAGAVTAFKFRDPDGHPLEFLQFPNGKIPVHWKGHTSAGVFRGIDHSAISVARINRSLHFYEALGLHLAMRTLNHGLEQQRLDGVSDPQVDVIGLAPPRPTPHVELLHYRNICRPTHKNLASNDTAATRLIFSTDENAKEGTGRLIQDPDGHSLQVFDRVQG